MKKLNSKEKEIYETLRKDIMKLDSRVCKLEKIVDKATRRLKRRVCEVGELARGTANLFRPIK